MLRRLGKVQHRCKARVAAFHQGLPVRLRLGFDQRGHARLEGRPLRAVVLRLCGHIREAQLFEQSGIKLRLDGAKGHKTAVAALKHLVKRRAVAKEVGLRLIDPGAVAAQLVDERAHGRHAIHHGRIHHLATPGLARLHQRAEHAKEQKHGASAHIAHHRGGNHRGLAHARRGVQHAGQSDVIDVVARRMGQRPILAPASHAAIHQARGAGRHGLGPKTQALHHAGPKTFQKCVRRFQKLPDGRLAFLAFEIYGNGPLAPVHGRAGAPLGAPGIGRAVDHDNVGAHIGQHHAGKGPRTNAGKFNDAQAMQRPGARAVGGGRG